MSTAHTSYWLPDDDIEWQLATVDVPETRYRIDFDLHDRSLQFSSELLKLALAGIAVVGFFLASLPETHRARLLSDTSAQRGLIFAVIGFAGSVACALLHRYFAGGAALHHVQLIKTLLLPTRDGSLNERLMEERKRRGVKFRRLHYSLIVSGLLLFLAAALLGWVFIRLLQGT